MAGLGFLGEPSLSAYTVYVSNEKDNTVTVLDVDDACR